MLAEEHKYWLRREIDNEPKLQISLEGPPAFTAPLFSKGEECRELNKALLERFFSIAVYCNIVFYFLLSYVAVCHMTHCVVVIYI